MIRRIAKQRRYPRPGWVTGCGGRTASKPGARFRSFADAEEGQKVRLRAESFADHYSQARQFFNSQTVHEQKHIAMALTFELSKVETPVIRERMVAHLLNTSMKGCPRCSASPWEFSITWGFEAALIGRERRLAASIRK